MKNFTVSTFLILVVSCVAIAQPTPIAYYPFSGNANDAGSNGLNGTAYGNPELTTDQDNNPLSAYLFDGINDYINLGGSTLLKPASQVTLALWAYSGNWSAFTSWAALAGNTASGGYELIIHGSTGVLEMEIRRNGTYGIADYKLSSITTGWHHFAMTFDGRYGKLYVDGVLVDTDDAGAVYPIQYGYPNNSTIIGDEAGSGSTPEGDRFAGKIDEVRFYDVALSDSQILALSSSQTSVEEYQEPFTLNTAYPNPATKQVKMIVNGKDGWYKVNLVNMLGDVVSKQNIMVNNSMLEFSRPGQLVPGLYILSTESPEGKRISQKITFR